MTSKVCGKCGTYIDAGRYCPECGQQLYPDVGETIWDYVDCYVRMCKEPKFDVWTGKAVKQ